MQEERSFFLTVWKLETKSGTNGYLISQTTQCFAWSQFIWLFITSIRLKSETIIFSSDDINSHMTSLVLSTLNMFLFNIRFTNTTLSPLITNICGCDDRVYNLSLKFWVHMEHKCHYKCTRKVIWVPLWCVVGLMICAPFFFFNISGEWTSRKFILHNISLPTLIIVNVKI